MFVNIRFQYFITLQISRPQPNKNLKVTVFPITFECILNLISFVKVRFGHLHNGRR